MLAWLFDLLTSIITFILGLFGIDYKSKTVTFADEAEKSEEKNDDTTNTVEVTETKAEENSSNTG